MHAKKNPAIEWGSFYVENLIDLASCVVDSVLDIPLGVAERALNVAFGFGGSALCLPVQPSSLLIGVACCFADFFLYLAGCLLCLAF